MEAPFPLASVLNDQVVLETLGIPIEVFVSATGLAIAIAIIVSLELFEQETDRALADARRRELLLRERERIGRDLHDGIIQSIYAAGLHLEQASAEIGDNGAPARERIATVMGELNRITNDIRSTIFALRSGRARDARRRGDRARRGRRAPGPHAREARRLERRALPAAPAARPGGGAAPPRHRGLQQRPSPRARADGERSHGAARSAASRWRSATTASASTRPRFPPAAGAGARRASPTSGAARSCSTRG